MPAAKGRAVIIRHSILNQVYEIPVFTGLDNVKPERYKNRHFKTIQTSIIIKMGSYCTGRTR